MTTERPSSETIQFFTFSCYWDFHWSYNKLTTKPYLTGPSMWWLDFTSFQTLFFPFNRCPYCSGCFKEQPWWPVMTSSSSTPLARHLRRRNVETCIHYLSRWGLDRALWMYQCPSYTPRPQKYLCETQLIHFHFSLPVMVDPELVPANTVCEGTVYTNLHKLIYTCVQGFLVILPSAIFGWNQKT